MLIAHRANDNHKFIENTKEAVLSCLNKPYIDGIEIDIRITKDNHFVLIHSFILDLITNGNGLVKNKTLKELKKYKFKNNQRISTLIEILKIMNQKILMIEIKEESKNYKKVGDLFYKIIKKYKYLNIIVCSFNYELLIYLKKLDKNIKCTLIITSLINENKIYNHLDSNSLSLNKLDRAKDKDFIWTINNIDNYKKVKKFNQNLNVITDIPYQLYEIDKRAIM